MRHAWHVHVDRGKDSVLVDCVQLERAYSLLAPRLRCGIRRKLAASEAIEYVNGLLLADGSYGTNVRVALVKYPSDGWLYGKALALPVVWQRVQACDGTQDVAKPATFL